MSSRPTVISLCDRTGNMVEPWRQAGYECWIVDLQHPEGIEAVDDSLITVGADVRRWLPPLDVVKRLAAAFAFPPCTNLAVSGARWFQEKGLQGLLDGLETVEACRRLLDWMEAPWCLENPVGSLSTYWRKPDYTFQPWHFGDLESKRTCLWTGHGFQMPAFRNLIKPDGVKESTWKMPPSAERGDLRSITPPGFAEAVFMANRRPQLEKIA